MSNVYQKSSSVANSPSVSIVSQKAYLRFLQELAKTENEEFRIAQDFQIQTNKRADKDHSEVLNHKRSVSTNLSYLRQQMAVKKQEKLKEKINEINDYRTKYDNLHPSVLSIFPRIIGIPDSVKRHSLKQKQLQINAEMQNMMNKREEQMERNRIKDSTETRYKFERMKNNDDLEIENMNSIKKSKQQEYKSELQNAMKLKILEKKFNDFSMPHIDDKHEENLRSKLNVAKFAESASIRSTQRSSTPQSSYQRDYCAMNINTPIPIYENEFEDSKMDENILQERENAEINNSTQLKSLNEEIDKMNYEEIENERKTDLEIIQRFFNQEKTDNFNDEQKNPEDLLFEQVNGEGKYDELAIGEENEREIQTAISQNIEVPKYIVRNKDKKVNDNEQRDLKSPESINKKREITIDKPSKNMSKLMDYLKEKESKTTRLLEQLNKTSKEEDLDIFNKTAKSTMSSKSNVSRYSKNKLKAALQKPNFYLRDNGDMQKVCLEGEKIILETTKKPKIENMEKDKRDDIEQKFTIRDESKIVENGGSKRIYDKLKHKLLYDDLKQLEGYNILNNTVNEHSNSGEDAINRTNAQKEALDRYLKSLGEKINTENKRMGEFHKIQHRETNREINTEVKKQLLQIENHKDLQTQIIENQGKKMNEIYEKVHVPDIVGNQGYPPLKEEEKLEKLHRIREIQNIQKKIWDNQLFEKEKLARKDKQEIIKFSQETDKQIQLEILEENSLIEMKKLEERRRMKEAWSTDENINRLKHQMSKSPGYRNPEQVQSAMTTITKKILTPSNVESTAGSFCHLDPRVHVSLHSRTPDPLRPRQFPQEHLIGDTSQNFFTPESRMKRIIYGDKSVQGANFNFPNLYDSHKKGEPIGENISQGFKGHKIMHGEGGEQSKRNKRGPSNIAPISPNVPKVSTHSRSMSVCGGQRNKSPLSKFDISPIHNKGQITQGHKDKSSSHSGYRKGRKYEREKWERSTEGASSIMNRTAGNGGYWRKNKSIAYTSPHPNQGNKVNKGNKEYHGYMKNIFNSPFHDDNHLQRATTPLPNPRKVIYK